MGTLDSTIAKLLKEEEKNGIDDIRMLQKFAKRVQILKSELHKTLVQIKRRGKTVAAYGAAAKGNILLNFCGISNKLIEFAVDSTPYKQGLYTPGSKIPIFPESEIVKRRPDYVLILAWNFAEEIMNKQKQYKTRGGRFIIPVPQVTVV